MSLFDCVSEPTPRPAPECGGCFGSGRKPDLVCCGRVLGTGECCAQPEPGWVPCPDCVPQDPSEEDDVPF